MMLNMLLAAIAVAEAATGVLLILLPGIVLRVIFGPGFDGPAQMVGRFAGVALVSLAVMCWMGRQTTDRGPIWAGLLTYNGLVAIVLSLAALMGQASGVLLWPVVAIHAALVLPLFLIWRRAASPGQH